MGRILPQDAGFDSSHPSHASSGPISSQGAVAAAAIASGGLPPCWIEIGFALCSQKESIHRWDWWEQVKPMEKKAIRPTDLPTKPAWDGWQPVSFRGELGRSATPAPAGDTEPRSIG